MKQKTTKTYMGIFFLVLALGFLQAFPALARSPWQWEMTLAVNTRGDAMYMPAAVSFDPASGRYYVVDTGKSRLVSFSRQGELLKAFSANNSLSAPFDMVRLDNGKLWVVEKGKNSLTLIDIATQKITPHNLEDNGHLVFPDRLAESDGKLYVLDRASGQVLLLNDDLTVAQHFGCDDCPGVVVDFFVDHGTVWTLDVLGKNIYQYDADGVLQQTIPLGDKVNFPISLTMGPSSSLFVLDRHKGRVVVFGTSGQFMYDFLEVGKGPEQLYFPRQIRFDPWGQLCVVDEGNGRVEVFSR